MYSVEDRYTFENLQEWIENCRDSVDPDNFTWAIVGNKSDLPMEVDHESVKARADQLATKLSFFTSAKTGENVISSLEEVVRDLYRQKSGKANSATVVKKEVTVKVQHTSHQKKKWPC